METAIKLHIYVDEKELNEKEANDLLWNVRNNLLSKGIKIDFQIYEVYKQ